MRYHKLLLLFVKFNKVEYTNITQAKLVSKEGDMVGFLFPL